MQEEKDKMTIAEKIAKTIETKQEYQRQTKAAKLAKIAECLENKLRRKMIREVKMVIHLTNKQLISPRYLGWRGWMYFRLGNAKLFREKELNDVLKILQDEPAKFTIRFKREGKRIKYCISVIDNPSTDCQNYIW